MFARGNWGFGSRGARIVATLGVLSLALGGVAAAGGALAESQAAHAATPTARLVQVYDKSDSFWTRSHGLGSDSELRINYQLEVPKGWYVSKFAYDYNGDGTISGGENYTFGPTGAKNDGTGNWGVSDVGNGIYREIRRDNFGDVDRVTLSVAGDLGGRFDGQSVNCPYDIVPEATQVTVKDPSSSASQTLSFTYDVRLWGADSSTCASASPPTAKPSMTLGYDHIFGGGGTSQSAINSQWNYGWVTSDGSVKKNVLLVQFLSPLKNRTDVNGQCTNVTSFFYQFFRADGTVADKVTPNPVEVQVPVVTGRWDDDAWSSSIGRSTIDISSRVNFAAEGPGYYKLVVWPIATAPDGTNNCTDHTSYYTSSVGNPKATNAFVGGSVFYTGGKPAAEVNKSFQPVTSPWPFARNVMPLDGKAYAHYTIDAGGVRMGGVGFTDTLPAALVFTGAVKNDSCGLKDKSLLVIEDSNKTIRVPGRIDFDPATQEVASVSGLTLDTGMSCSFDAEVTNDSSVTGPSACPAKAQTNDISNISYSSLNTVMGNDKSVTAPTQSAFGECLTIDAIADVAVRDVTVNLAPGQTGTVSFPVKNESGSPVTNVPVTITAPANTTFTGTAPSGCTMTSSTLTCTIAGPMKADPDATSNHAIDASIKASGAAPTGSYTSAIQLGSPTSYSDFAAANDKATFTVAIGTASTDLAVADLSNAAAPITPGGSGATSFTLKNLGPSDTSTGAVTYAAPAGITINSVTDAGLAARCMIAADKASLTCTSLALEAGQTLLFPLDVTVASSVAPQSIQTKSGGLTTPSGGDPVVSNNQADVAIHVGATAADLGVAFSPTASKLVPGAAQTASLVVTNHGPSDAPASAMTWNPPADLAVTNLPAECTQASGQVTCSVPALSASGTGSAKTFAFTVAVDAGYLGSATSDQALTGTAELAPTFSEGANTHANTVATPFGVTQPQADLTHAKTAAMPATDKDSKLSPGEDFQYTIRTWNLGPSVATNVAVSDRLPAGLTFVSGTGCSGSEGNTVVTCGPMASLPVGVNAAISYTFWVHLDSGFVGEASDLFNTATLSASTSDVPNPTPEPGPTPPPDYAGPLTDVTYRKSAALLDGATALHPGDVFTYSIEAINYGPSDAKNVQVSDTLPPHISYVSSPDGCGASGQLVSCPPIATLKPGGPGVNTHTHTFTVRLDPAYTGDGSDLGNVADVVPGSATPEIPDPTPDPGPVYPPDPQAEAKVSHVKTAAVLPTDSDKKLSPGEHFTYSITAWNDGPSVARGVVLADRLPAGITFVRAIDGACSAIGQDVTCGPIAALAVGGRSSAAATSFTFEVALDPSYLGTGSEAAIVNHATESATTPLTPVPAPPGTPLPDYVGPIADLEKSKKAAVLATDADGKLSPGEDFSYTISVKNWGPSTARNVTISDELPDGVTFVSSAGNTCTSSTSRVVTCPTSATLAPGATVSYTFTAHLDSSYDSGPDGANNTATIASLTPEPDPDPHPDPDPVPLPNYQDPTADLEKTKQAAVAPDDADGKLSPGEQFRYTITVKNWGPSAAKRVRITDALPGPVSFVSSTDGCTAVGQQVDCGEKALLDAGESASYTIIVRLAADYTGTASQAANLATITADTPEPKPDPHPDPDPTDLPDYVGPQAHLVKSKAIDMPAGDADGRLSPGEDVLYTITVRNEGPSVATDVDISDELPAPFTFVSSSQGCTSGDGTNVTCGEGLTLQPDAEVSYTFTAHLDSGFVGSVEQLKNTAAIATGTTDPDDDGDPSVTPEDYAGPLTDVTYRKTASLLDGKTTLAPGERFQYSIETYNLGPSDARDVTVTDLLPAGITFASSANGCSAAKDPASGRDKVTCPQIQTLKPGGLGSSASVTSSFVVTLAADYDGDGSDLGNVAVVQPGPGTPEVPNPSVDPDPVFPPDPKAQAKVVHDKTAAVLAGDQDGKLSPGEHFTYTIAVWNEGPSVAKNVIVSDVLPPFVTFVRPLVGACAASGQDVSCGPIGALALGAKDSVTAQSFTFEVALDPDYSGSGDEEGILNTATESADTPLTPVDPPEGTALPDYVGPIAQLVKTKTAAQQPAMDLNGDGTLNPGEQFTYRIDVTNSGPSVAHNIEITDPLPEFVTWEAGACKPAEDDPTTAICPTIGTLAVGQTQAYTMVVRLAADFDPAGTKAASDAVNTAVVTSVTPGPAGAGDKTNEEPLPGYGGPAASLERTKSAEQPPALDASGDGRLNPGERFTYRIGAKNLGPSDAQQVTFEDLLPAGVTFDSSTNGCTGAVSNLPADKGRTRVTCPSVATLGLGKDVSYAFTVLLDEAFDAGDLGAAAALNAAVIGAKTPEQGGDKKDEDNTDKTPDTPLPNDPEPRTDVTFVKTASLLDGAASLHPGDDYTYSIEAINFGPSLAKDVSVADLLPAGLSFVTSSDGCTGALQADGPHAGRTLVTCPTIARLGVDTPDAPRTKSVSATFTVHLDSEFTGTKDDLGNVAIVTPGSTTPEKDDPTPDPGPVYPEEPSASSTLDYEKTAAPLPGGAVAGKTAAGENFTYTIKVWNTGPSAAKAVVVKDALPKGITFVAAKHGACAVDQTTTATDPAGREHVVCGPIATLSVGDKDSDKAQTFTFEVRLDPAYAGDGSENAMCNYASFEAATPLLPSAEPQCARIPDFAGRLTDVTYSKAITRPADGKVTPGEDLDYTITALNFGPATASDVSVSDLLPAGLTFVASDDGCVGKVSQAAADAGRTLVSCPTIPALGVSARDKSAGGVSYTFTAHLDAAYKGDGKDLGNTAIVAPGPATPEVPKPTPDPDPTYPAEVVNKPVLDISKVASTTNPQPGEKVTYTLTLANVGTGYFDPATVSDDLADVLDDAVWNSDATAVASPAPASGAVPQPVLKGTTLTWSGPIDHAQTITLTYSVTVMDNPTGNLALVNSVLSDDVGSTCPTGNTNPKCSTGKDGTGGIPRIEIKHSSSPRRIAAGERSRVSVVVTNTGKGVAKAIRLADEFDELAGATEFAGNARASSGRISYGSIIWDGDIEAGASATIAFDVAGIRPGTSVLHMVPANGGTNCPTSRAAAECSTSVEVVAEDETLPFTGPQIAGAAGLGVLSGAIGIVLWLAAKRRREHVEQE